MKHTKKKRIETMFDQNLVPNVLLYKFRERFSPDAVTDISQHIFLIKSNYLPSKHIKVESMSKQS